MDNEGISLIITGNRWVEFLFGYILSIELILLLKLSVGKCCALTQRQCVSKSCRVDKRLFVCLPHEEEKRVDRKALSSYRLGKLRVF